MRAGAKTLTLLGTRRTYLILQALSTEPAGQLELRRAAGFPAQSTLRGHMKALEAAGAVIRRRQDPFPGTLEYELNEAGRELLTVAEHLCRWLAEAPSDPPLEPGGDAARATVKGLVDGWLAQMLVRLAEEPLSLTELDRRLTTVSYPTIERRLETMRLAGQVEERERTGTGTPYTLAPWFRRGVTPLVAAARWEHRHRLAGADPVTRLEVESALKIAAPLLALPSSLTGICQVAVRAPGESDPRRRSLAFLELKDGDVSFGLPYPDRKPDAWISGTADAWFDAMIEGGTNGLRTRGEPELAEGFIELVRTALFGERRSEFSQVKTD